MSPFFNIAALTKTNKRPYFENIDIQIQIQIQIKEWLLAKLRHLAQILQIHMWDFFTVMVEASLRSF